MLRRQCKVKVVEMALLAIAAVLFVFPAAVCGGPFPQCLSFEGAGDPAFNGVYELRGEPVKGQPSYKMIGGEAYIYWWNEIAPSQWVIDADLDYWNDNNGYWNPDWVLPIPNPIVGTYHDFNNYEVLGELVPVWCDVASVPALDQWGIMFFTILLAASAVWVLRRKRHTT